MGLWRQAYAQKPRETEAGSIIKFSRANQVFTEWRRVIQLQRVGRQFRQQNYDRFLLKIALKALGDYKTSQNYHDYTVQLKSSQRNGTLVGQVFRALVSVCQQQKLQCGLDVYCNHKVAKKYLLALKKYTDLKNAQRLNLIKIRAALAENPNLKRPLLVLRNFPLKKCFSALQAQCAALKEQRQMNEYASYAAYLRLLRKSFYSIKLNVAQKFQTQTSLKI